LLSNTADRILDAFDKVPNEFTMFTAVKFLDVDGTGAEKLMIGADTAGAGFIGVDSAVFDVSKQKLTPLLSVATMVLYKAEIENIDIHTLTLDERQTIRSGGKRFVFIKKTFAEKRKISSKPLTRRVSFPPGYGLPLDWQ